MLHGHSKLDASRVNGYDNGVLHPPLALIKPKVIGRKREKSSYHFPTKKLHQNELIPLHYATLERVKKGAHPR